ncbi:Hydrogenase transcriptional regulatory protein hupR1 [Rubripirellula amarantea]|uniref:Hydrogenase transcriptional regulatory protein hupR1 n=1 Tax=Rubripirellula amarantea TaxID=2527999 RepID=A0A5C5WKR6_9BACT|nr:response regulator [Rubripirellula amarantea]TWT50563.1 Hydrogenase transcriptional regulatory protein hupR1 [Rubripirellula amarantea]
MEIKTKVMFVDDEANVLAGLRRMLRSQRKVWDMRFANGGEDALQELAKDPVDVIVSDMRMPGIDGAELLSRVSELYPNTVRLVLSGQSEHEKIFRAIGPAHQFMSKPCDPDVLISTIDRACGLQSQLSDESLKNVASQITTLPSLPTIYRELVSELESNDASMDRIGRMIGSDLAMTAKVLQLVNSSFFGLPTHVTCPTHAVSMLGLNIIRPLVLTANAFSQYEDPGVEGFSLETSIQHSLAVATSARSIAESVSQQNHLVDDAFIAGMLHDVGKLILAVNLPEKYSEASRLANVENVPLWQAELDVFGTTHAEVGAHLLGLWGLPNPIIEAVAFHHRPSDAETTCFTPLTAVHVADVLQDSNYPNDDSPASLTWDLDYLNAIHATGQLDGWSIMVDSGVLS